MNLKSNVGGNPVAAHFAMTAFLAGISNEWDRPEVALETASFLLRETHLPKDHIAGVLSNFNQAALLIRATDTDYVKQTVISLEKQRAMMFSAATEEFLPLHDVALAFLSGIMPNDETADIKLRTILAIVDVTDLPIGSLEPIFTVGNYKTIEIGVANKSWATGPLRGLYIRLDSEEEADKIDTDTVKTTGAGEATEQAVA